MGYAYIYIYIPNTINSSNIWLMSTVFRSVNERLQYNNDVPSSMEMVFGSIRKNDFPLSTRFWKPSFIAVTTLPTSVTRSKTTRKNDTMLPFLKQHDSWCVSIIHSFVHSLNAQSQLFTITCKICIISIINMKHFILFSKAIDKQLIVAAFSLRLCNVTCQLTPVT